MNLVLRPLGVHYEEAVLGPDDALFEHVLRMLAQALRRGLPVPALLVDAEGGKPLQPVLFLQSDESAGRRRLQVHALFSRETIWLDEGVLRTRESLPVQDGERAVVGRICLPDESTMGRYGVT